MSESSPQNKSNEGQSDSDDPTKDIREETEDILQNSNFNQAEVMGAIMLYLPQLTKQLDMIRQELTLITAMLKEEGLDAEEERVNERHEQADEIMSQTHDIEFNRVVVSILDSLESQAGLAR